jgi:hypothetical protein
MRLPGHTVVKSVLFFSFLLSAIMPCTASIRLLESSNSRCSFRWELEKADTVSCKEDSEIVTQLSFSGQNIVLGEAGEPALPAFSVFIGVPFSGEVRVTFTPGATRTLILEHPCKRHPKETATRQKNLVFAQCWISNPRYTWIRGRRVVHLVVRPLDYDRRRESVAVLTSGMCTVEFPPDAGTNSADDNGGDRGRLFTSLLINADVAARWKKSDRAALGKETSVGLFTDNGGWYTFKIGDGNKNMNETSTKENGIVKITGELINRFFPGRSISIKQVALYAASKQPLPSYKPGPQSISDGIFEIPLVRCDRNTNGVVDSGDFFLAYVTGLNDWTYADTVRDYAYVVNPYGDERTYWLTVKSSGEGMTMPKAEPVTVTVADTVDYSPHFAAFGQANYYISQWVNGTCQATDNPGWVFEILSPLKSDFSLPLDLPNLDTNADGKFRFIDLENCIKHGIDTLSATVGNTLLCEQCYSFPYMITSWGNRVLKMHFSPTSGAVLWQLQRVIVEYRQKLALSASLPRLTMFSPVEDGAVCYNISGLNGESTFIVRVSDDDRNTSLVDSLHGLGTYTWSDVTGMGARYFVCRESAVITLADTAFERPARLIDSVQEAENPFILSDLRNLENESDYLIVTHPKFLAQALRLAHHKMKMGFYRPRIASINEVYAAFSGGTNDPTALRNFLAYASFHWNKGDALDYVVLMGAGNWDYKRYLTSEINYIPPAYQTLFNAGASDDYFVTFNADPEPFLAIGRLPCQDSAEAAVLVDKIIQVEDSGVADYSAWRNTALFVADDDMQGPNPDLISGEYGHYRVSERIAAKITAVRPSLTLRKTYLFEFPWDSLYRKPEAARAIVDEINNGVGYVNYIGHGQPAYWADENVFSVEDIERLTNNERYPLVGSFACSVGAFDKPDASTLSETLVKAPGAGAIAAYAASRSSSAICNEILAGNFYSCLFETPVGLPFGLANVKAKILASDRCNSNCYLLFGDPSLQLARPNQKMRLRVSEGVAMPVPSASASSVLPLTVQGCILSENNTTDISFGNRDGANIRVNLFRAPVTTKRKDNGSDTTVRYTLGDSVVFSTVVPVNSGTFELTATVPASPPFNAPNARLTAYAWDGARIAVGDSVFSQDISVLSPIAESMRRIAQLQGQCSYGTTTVSKTVRDDHSETVRSPLPIKSIPAVGFSATTGVTAHHDPALKRPMHETGAFIVETPSSKAPPGLQRMSLPEKKSECTVFGRAELQGSVDDYGIYVSLRTRSTKNPVAIATTDKDGNYTLSIRDTGSYVLRFEAPRACGAEYPPLEMPIALAGFDSVRTASQVLVDKAAPVIIAEENAGFKDGGREIHGRIIERGSGLKRDSWHALCDGRSIPLEVSSFTWKARIDPAAKDSYTLTIRGEDNAGNAALKRFWTTRDSVVAVCE